MHRRAFLSSCGQAVLVSGVFPPIMSMAKAAVGRRKDLIAEIDKRVPEALEEAQVPGASIALVDRGRLLWRGAFGFKDVAAKAPVTHKTLFEAASISKTVFAYAALKLCEKGTLGLDIPLTKYTATKFLDGDARLDLVTPRHVLSHSAGFPNWRSKSEPMKINFEPGKGFNYSGEGYFYLQSVISQLTGRAFPEDCAKYELGLQVCGTDFDEYLRKNLLSPFGMSLSRYLWDDVLGREAARPHRENGEAFVKPKPGRSAVARYGSAGGLYTNATEYSKFLVEMLTPKQADRYRLTAGMRKEMFRPQVKLPADQKLDGADSWALGWAVQERKTGQVLVHSGGQDGFRSLTMASPRNQSGFIILTNGENGGKVCYDKVLGQLLNELLEGKV
jgi:CubicO group peptidase (beta-lactamase class C family)